MVAEPLDRLDLVVTSFADDVGFVALADIARALGGHTSDYRLIGGRMVQIHVHRWRLGQELYRETSDADVGVNPVLLGGQDLEARLVRLGYQRQGGNRFVREIQDLPVVSTRGRYEAAIDVLIPERGEPRPRPRTVGDWTADVAPGLRLALRRPPIGAEMVVRRLNGEELSIACLVPDELSALALKLAAWRTRLKDTDAVDLWRCLEVLAVAGIDEDFDSPSLDRLAEELDQAVSGDRGEFLARTIGQYRGINSQARRQVLVRIRALAQRIMSGGGTPSDS